MAKLCGQGTAGLHSYLSFPLTSMGGGVFSSFTTVNAGFWQGHKSTEETERKYSHKLLGRNMTSHDIPASSVICLSVDVAARRAAGVSIHNF